MRRLTYCLLPLMLSSACMLGQREDSRSSDLPDAPSAIGARTLAPLQDVTGSQAAAQAGSQAGALCGLSGLVKDPNGGPVENATITVTGIGRPISLSATTDGSGRFALENLQPGRYRLAVQAAGFQSATTPELTIHPGEQQTLPAITLQLATAKVDVTVVATPEQIAIEQVHEEEKQRVFGIFPAFYTSYIWQAAPLPVQQKFGLATHSAFDPIAFASVGLVAGVEQAIDFYPAYNLGAEGYAKRFGASFADESIGRFFGSAIYPSLFHQDPRYFYNGVGAKKHRAAYALSRTLVTRGDNGKMQPNYSLILGRLTAAAISNAYHPAGDRGVGLTFGNALLNLAGNAADNLAREFLFRRLTPSVPDFANGQAPPKEPGKTP